MIRFGGEPESLECQFLPIVSNPRGQAPNSLPSWIGSRLVIDKVGRMSVGIRWLEWVLLPAFAIAAAHAAFTPAASAQAARAADESFFVEQLHPVLYAVQCEQCHNDN